MSAAPLCCACIALLAASQAIGQQASHKSQARAHAFPLKEGVVFDDRNIPKKLPTDEEHPQERDLAGRDEQIITGGAKILLLQYGVYPDGGQPNDDVALVARPIAPHRYKILLVRQSMAGDEYDSDFVEIEGKNLLYIQSQCACSSGATQNEVYAFWRGQLFAVPFVVSKVQHARQKSLLHKGESMFNGGMNLTGDVFSLELGIYGKDEAGCCPSGGTYHAVYELTGDLMNSRSIPTLRFQMTKQWREPPEQHSSGNP